MKLFISHSSKDRVLVRTILEKLPKQYRNTWIDEEDIASGDSIEGSIQKAISQDCDFVLIFLSERSIKSPWVKKELRLALAHEKVIERKFVIPVLFDSVWSQISPKSFQKRLFMQLYSQEPSQIADLASRLSGTLGNAELELTKFKLELEVRKGLAEAEVKINVRSHENTVEMHSRVREREEGLRLARRVLVGPQSGMVPWMLDPHELARFDFLIPKSYKDQISHYVGQRILGKNCRRDADEIFESLRQWWDESKDIQ